jgi:iron complex outermembrane receptor protein
MNHTRVDAAGFEAVVGYRYGYWLKNVEASYSYTRLNKSSNEMISKYALDYLKHKLAVRLEHKIYKNFGASWQFTLQKRNGNYKNINNEIVDYQLFGLFDGRIYWQNQTLKIFVEATNILNAKYYDIGGIIQPERWVKAGASVDF